MNMFMGDTEERTKRRRTSFWVADIWSREFSHPMRLKVCDSRIVIFEETGCFEDEDREVLVTTV
jgi:hypothetical protein